MSHNMTSLLKVRFISVFCVCLLLCMLSISTGQCRPSEADRMKQRHHYRQRTTAAPIRKLDDETIERIRPCHENSTTMELCQRCAKESKAVNVFPLCCANIDEVQNWCAEYIFFGTVP